MTSSDTSRQSAAVLTELYRAMSPADKIARIFSAYQTGQKIALAGLKSRHPQATAQSLWNLWAKQHLGEALYNIVYGTTENE